jgi:DNA-binding response OmpR family regulator
MRVLLAERDEATASALAATLSRSHRICGTTSVPAHALAIADQMAPDLAIVAARLAPDNENDSDGIDLGFTLMARGIAVLFIVDDLDEADAISARRPACGTGCLTRPYRPEQVRSALANMTELLLTQRLPQAATPGVSLFI